MKVELVHENRARNFSLIYIAFRIRLLSLRYKLILASSFESYLNDIDVLLTEHAQKYQRQNVEPEEAKDYLVLSRLLFIPVLDSA